MTSKSIILSEDFLREIMNELKSLNLELAEQGGVFYNNTAARKDLYDEDSLVGQIAKILNLPPQIFDESAT